MIKIAGHIVLIGVVLVCLYHSVTAQNLQIDITHSSIENGLSQTSVNCLFQDAHGFLWVGTQDGLNKYDGYSFEVFRNQPRKANTLSDNLIHSICEDNNGNIWIATHSGLNKYDVTSGSFKPYTTDVHVGAILAEHNCQYVYEDRNHFIWIKIEGHLYKLNPTTGKVKTYALPDETADFNNRYSITQDWLGFIWIATSNGLMVLNDKQEFEIYDTKSNKTKNISNNEIRVIYETSKSHLFIGTSYGLNYFNRSNLNFDTYYFQGTHSDNVVNAICEDENDVLWVGTQNGIKFFSKSQNKFLDNYYISNYTNNVVEGEISSIIRDKSGVFWVGSQNGLYKINTQKRKFNLYRKTSDVLTGTNIAGNNITALMVMDNLIWVGTRFDGLTLLERKTGNAINHTVQGQNTISDNYISTFFKTKKGDILIGTGNGLNYCKPAPPNTMKYTIYPFPYKGNYFSKNRINAITEQTHDIYWIATNRGLFTVKNQTVTLFENRGFTSEEVYDLLFDKDSLLWL